MLSRTKTKPVTRAAAKSSHYVLDEQVGFLMRVAMQRHTSIFMSQMIAELTQTQFAALAKLHEVGPCSQNHLGRLIYLDAATIKGVVDRLGCAASSPRSRSERPPPPRRGADRTGPRSYPAAIQIAADITATTLRPLTADEQRTLARLLKKLT